MVPAIRLEITTIRTSAGVAYSDTTVAVAPTDTVMSEAISCHQMENMAIALTNTDGSQSLNAWLEVAPASSGPWDRSPWTGLEEIAAGETRYETAAVRGRRYVRLVGIASGAGLNARLWLDLVNG